MNGATMQDCDNLVTRAYRSAMSCASEKNLSRIAFSLLGSAVPEEGSRGWRAGSLPERKIGQLLWLSGGPHGQPHY